jgi:MoaA/NifB/PqqE/SkfB family radical SAM enzyme
MQLRTQGDMPWELFTRLTAELYDAGVEELGLFYLGESLLLPNLHKYIDYAKNKIGFDYVFLTTNGTLATPYRLERLFSAGLDSLKFSYNYADAEQFEEISGMPAKLFPGMVKNVKSAQRIRNEVEQRTGHRCSLSASYISYDGKQGERMKSAVAEIEPYMDEIYALPLYSQAEHVGDAERAKGWQVTHGNRGRVGALREPLPCWSCFTEAHITCTGLLSLCCFDHDGRFVVGDLKQEKFMSLWNNDKFQSIRAAHLRKDVTGTVCEKCAVG